MNRTAMVATAVAIGTALLSLSATKAHPAPDAASPMVRLAELVIDPAQIEAYKAILAEEQEASLRLEPGVLMLHSAAITDHPTHIRLFEVYASRRAYEAHIKAPHFVKYKTSTEKMVKSLRLIPATPILLCAKSEGLAGGSNTCM